MLQTRALNRQKICNLLLKTNYLNISINEHETNVNLLLNTCNFHCTFWFIFSLILSENAPNVHFREAKFQNFQGEQNPDPFSVLAPSALDPILAGPTLNCFRRAW